MAIEIRIRPREYKHVSIGAESDDWARITVLRMIEDKFSLPEVYGRPRAEVYPIETLGAIVTYAFAISRGECDSEILDQLERFDIPYEAIAPFYMDIARDIAVKVQSFEEKLKADGAESIYIECV